MIDGSVQAYMTNSSNGQGLNIDRIVWTKAGTGDQDAIAKLMFVLKAKSIGIYSNKRQSSNSAHSCRIVFPALNR